MLFLLPLWLVLVAILVGWGLLVIWALRRAGGEAFGGALTTFQTMWLGYASLIGFLELCSLVMPIDRAVLVVSFAPAVAGYILHRRAVTRRLRSLRQRPCTVAVIACVILGAWLAVAYAACDLVKWYDTGLYHLQVVKWDASYSAVPGLANLHLRFGYNNSVHLFGAFVDAFWQGESAHLMNGFLMAAVLGQWVTEMFSARTPRGRLRQAYCLLTLPLLLARLWTIEVASLSTDLALTISSFVLVLELLSLSRGSRQRFLLPLSLIGALGAVAVTTKLGGLALFGVAGALALLLVRDVTWRARVAVLALPALVVLGWLVRGVIASGWLVFPVFGRLPLAWSVPSDIAHAHLLQIESWSRMFGKEPDFVFGHGFWHWFGPWFDGFRQSHEMILLVIAIALLAWRIASGPAVSAARRAGEWAAVVACVLGIIQWFVGAPDLRYGSFLFWMLVAALFAPMIARALGNATLRPLILALSLALCVWSGGFAIRLDVMVPTLWGRPRFPQAPTTELTPIGSGAEVLFPTSSDQCFDAELPCTPAPANQTRRDLESLGAGFDPVP